MLLTFPLIVVGAMIFGKRIRKLLKPKYTGRNKYHSGRNLAEYLCSESIPDKHSEANRYKNRE